MYFLEKGLTYGILTYGIVEHFGFFWCSHCLCRSERVDWEGGRVLKVLFLRLLKTVLSPETDSNVFGFSFL